MFNSIQKYLLLLIFSFVALSAWAVVSEYSFTTTQATYTEISGGTVLGSVTNDNETFNAIPLGFVFTYNGVDYSNVSVACNGFVVMGDVAVTSNVPISSTTAGTSNNLVAGLSRDIKSRDNGELMYLLSGTAPNRIFTVQWKNYRRVPTTTINDILNFQIQLHENGNKVAYVYGPITAVTAATAAAIQVGLRGDSNADFSNRTTTTDWAATIAGTAANNSCTLSATVFPAAGLTFTFAPAVAGEPPLPAQNPVPANNAVNVSYNAGLSWLIGGGVTDGYKVYLGTDNPPTNLVNGTTQTATTYDPADFSYNTTYYWKIVPYNQFGDAVDCPVWSFTTLADPTVTSYPYEQNFDDLTPPALPLGWTTINANGDTYAWETYAGNADSAPNSVRIRYNTTMAMNDWLLMPPFAMAADTNYKLTFKYRAASSTYAEKMAVYWGTAPTVDAMTNLLWSNENITNTTYETVQLPLIPTTTGTYYVGFKGYSDTDMFYLYIDTVEMELLTDVLDPPTNLTATVSGHNVALNWDAPGETPPPPEGFVDGFETYENFSIAFAPWTLVDVDQSTTYGMTGIAWTNAYAAQAYMVFNPSATTPAVTDLAAHSGDKMAACFASTTPPNNDWMITPQLTVAAGDVVKFWAKSYTAQYGLERFKVGVSTTGTAPANFTIISGASYVQAPIDWTEYSYNLSAYAGQNVYIGIQCLSNDAFIFLVDDFYVGAPAARGEILANLQPAAGSQSRQIGIAQAVAPAMRTVTRDLLGYKVYRDGALIATVSNPATTEYADNALVAGSYSYTVTAYYDGGESVPAGPATAVVTDALAMPENLAASVEGNDVTLTWDNPEPPATGDWITWATEALGNSVGTNSAATFDVAHRWTQADLAPYAGRTLTQLKFVPAYEACTYTVKVWTGGSATNAGTLVSSQVVTAPTIGDWNLVVLNTPVPIPTTGDLYYGFGVDTQGGYPAGCDDGPQVEGKGNMMYFQGAWTTLTALAPTLTYNWSVKAFAQTGAATKAVELTPIVEAPRAVSTGELALGRYEVPATRPVTGFKVYRDDVLIGTITDPAVTTYTDMDLANGTYTYGVTATHTTGESDPATVDVTVEVVLPPVLYGTDFEAYSDFATVFNPWTMIDVDQSTTYGLTDIEFPGSGTPMAYMVFNPTATVPPVTTITAHSGNKMAAAFASTTPPNNDWMVTPRMTLGTGSKIKFYAKSHTAQYGLERFRVGVSTLATIIPQGFQYVSGGTYVEAPTTWTEYIYDLSQYDGQQVYIGIRCVSNDAFIFFVDDFTVHSNGGSVSNDDTTAPVLQTSLQGNYPNPFNPETTIRFSTAAAGPVRIDIYNARGQLVKSLMNESREAGNHSIVWNGTDNTGRSIGSGIYYYKMQAGSYTSTRKMVLMK